MRLTTYVRLWIVVLIVLSYEFFALNRAPTLSLLGWIKTKASVLGDLNLDPYPGKTISLWLGWSGFVIMCMTNLYILRKRLGFMHSMGRVSRWLDFHIFCGLVGPTLILFHTNFKIGGLVAVSFWSMVISFLSGIIGRYFYIQLVQQQSELTRIVKAIEQQFASPGFIPVGSDAQRLQSLTTRLLQTGGATAFKEGAHFTLIRATFRSLLGDVGLKFALDRIRFSLPLQMVDSLRVYVVSKRRILFLEEFRKIMGYWHSFHFPFAVFMYVVAVIHIVTALLFKVNG